MPCPSQSRLACYLASNNTISERFLKIQSSPVQISATENLLSNTNSKQRVETKPSATAYKHGTLRATRSSCPHLLVPLQLPEVLSIENSFSKLSFFWEITFHCDTSPPPSMLPSQKCTLMLCFKHNDSIMYGQCRYRNVMDLLRYYHHGQVGTHNRSINRPFKETKEIINNNEKNSPPCKKQKDSKYTWII